VLCAKCKTHLTSSLIGIEVVGTSCCGKISQNPKLTTHLGLKNTWSFTSLSQQVFMFRCVLQVKLISAGDGNCRAELVVGPEHQSRMATLHGGLTATLVDSLSTLALVTHKVGVPGVTVDLHVS
jgi:acyl-coenzyme A thioesterase PaaI-like protein